MGHLRCPLCGTPGAACGQRTTTLGIVIETPKDATMSELKEYKTVNQAGIETTLLLSDEDAKTRGLTGGKAREVGYQTPELHTDTSERELVISAGVQPPVEAAEDDAEGVKGKARGSANK